MNTATTTAVRPGTRPKGGDLLYSFDGSFTDIVPIGPVHDGFRMNGHFAGPVTAGELTGAQVTGVDYFLVRHDGAGVVRAHEIVRAGESVIAVELHGLLLPPADVDTPRPDDIVRPDFAWPEQPYTIHVSAQFETADPDLDYLNTTVVAHTGTVNFTTGQLHIDARVVA
jgi:hypothetical protein